MKKFVFLLLIGCALFFFVPEVAAQAPFTGHTGLYLLGSESQAIPAADFAKTYVDGATVRVLWSALETAPGVFSWTFLDGEVAKATAANKKISLIVFGNPSWLAALGVQQYFYIDTNPSHPTYGDTLPDFVSWDAIYVERVIKLNQQLAQHFAANPTVSYCNTVAGFIARNLPSTNVLTPSGWKPIWQSFGYHPDTLVFKMKRILDAYMAVFPNTPLWNSMDYQIFEPAATGHAKNYIAQQYANYGLATYPNRFGVWREDLAGCNPPPSIQTTSQWYPVVQNPCRNGAQMLWNVQDGPTRMNQCGILPNSKSVVLDSAINRGIDLGMRYMEVYKVDMEDATLANMLTNAHARLLAKVQANCPNQPSVCSKFIISGNPENQTNGATWKYQSTDNGIVYDLQGILFKPLGNGPFPVVLINHGTGGNVASYSKSIAKEMVQWGYVCIAVNYTHSTGVPCGLPGTCAETEWGARSANLLRGKKCLELVACLSYADTSCFLAFGHSRGAFVTTGLTAAFPGLFNAVAHTAGGVSDDAGSSTATIAQAGQITTPYQMHHGASDVIVDLAWDQTLASVLTQHNVPNQLYTYPGYSHSDVRFATLMFARTKAWFAQYGCSADPVLDFSLSKSTGCAPLTVQVQSIGLGTNFTYQWAFPGGSPATSNASQAEVTFNQAGIYTITLTATENNAMYTVTKTVMVQNVASTSVQASICQGETILFNGQMLQTSGVYTANLTASNGCDSTVILNLNVLPLEISNIQATICQGESFQYNGQTLSSSGIYNFTVIGANGCIATVVLSLDVLPAVSSVQEASICAGETYAFNGQTLEVEGTYLANLTTISGCDSTITLHLNILPAASSVQEASICAGETYPFNGQTLEEAGIYSANLTAVNGCDSLLTLVLQVQPFPTAQFNFIANNSEVTFTNNSTNATTHFWDFGDNLNSFELAPTHQYAANGIYTVTLSESNVCGVSTFQQTVVIMVSNTSNQQKNIGWSVFPNPTSGTFIVKNAGATTRIAKLALFDLTGRQIQIDHQMLNQVYLVDCSSISNGTYLLQLSEENSPAFWTRVVICN